MSTLTADLGLGSLGLQERSLMKEKARNLHKDTRGAVMLTGLCMSCFLIGGLWFLMGIGDAIVFRDAMQEATDHAAFTSAVLHAKGMNFISACNLILVALIAIHIIMGIIHDILLAICIISLGTGCGAWLSWRNVYSNYGKGFKMAANVIHYLEEGAAIGYPFIGAYKAYKVGDDYGSFGKKRDVTVIALSTSMMPGSAATGLLNKLFKQTPDEVLPPGVQGPTRQATNGYSPAKKKFLPVEAKKFEDVCKRITSAGFDALLSLTGRNPGGKVMDIVKGLIGGVIAGRYCNPLGAGSNTDNLEKRIGEGNEAVEAENARRAESNAKLPQGGTPQTSLNKVDLDKIKADGIGGGIDPGLDQWWGKDGPLVPWGGTSNGSPWQQIWAFNMMPEYKDLNQNKVALAERRFGGEQETKKMIYFAQAEFFFDCTAGWSDYGCNKDDNAGYQIKWRARLKQFAIPGIGSIVASLGADLLKNVTAYTRFKDGLKGGAGQAGGGVDALIGMAEEFLGGLIGKGGNAVDGVQGEITGGIGSALGLVPYH